MKLETKEADIFDKYMRREPKPDEITTRSLSNRLGVSVDDARKILHKMVRSGEAELVTENGKNSSGYHCNIWRLT